MSKKRVIVKTPEAAVLRGCISYLCLKRIFHWRQNTGAVKIDKRFIQFGVAGMADIIAILPGGRFLAIECKASRGGRQSDAQQSFQHQVEEAGGIYRLVSDAQQLADFIESYRK